MIKACNRSQKLRPRCRHLANSTKHNVVFDSRPVAPLCENMIRHPQNRKYITSVEDQATVPNKGAQCSWDRFNITLYLKAVQDRDTVTGRLTGTRTRCIEWRYFRRLSVTPNYPWDDLRKIFRECQCMAKLTNGEKMPKISTG